MIVNWREEIAIAWLVKQAMRQLDKNKIYPYHLPEVAATDEQIERAEDYLGFSLDSRYKLFLKHANGWRGFLQTTDLFGTEDLLGGPRHEAAELILSMMNEGVLRQSQVRRDELLPIAASMSDRDLVVMMRPHTSHPGMVLWFGGEEIDRFPNFDEYFLAMVDYNRLEIQQFKEQGTDSN